MLEQQFSVKTNNVSKSGSVFLSGRYKNEKIKSHSTYRIDLEIYMKRKRHIDILYVL
jgi:hypothetical protein